MFWFYLGRVRVSDTYTNTHLWSDYTLLCIHNKYVITLKLFLGFSLCIINTGQFDDSSESMGALDRKSYCSWYPAYVSFNKLKSVNERIMAFTFSTRSGTVTRYQPFTKRFRMSLMRIVKEKLAQCFRLYRRSSVRQIVACGIIIIRHIAIIYTFHKEICHTVQYLMFQSTVWQCMSTVRVNA